MSQTPESVELSTSVPVRGRLLLDDIPDCESAKRAMEVALAGGHPLLLIYTTGAPAVELVRAGHAMAEAAGIGFHALAYPSCPCGAYGSLAHQCGCSPSRIVRHQAKIAKRATEFDIAIEVTTSVAIHSRRGEAEAAVLNRVIAAQGRRLSDTELSADCQALLRLYAQECGSGRLPYVLRVAETTARLDGAERVGAHHLCEAIQYQHVFGSFVAAAEVEVGRAGVPAGKGTKTKRAVVTVRGGVAEVVSCPPGVTIEIRDYDTEGCDSQRLADDGALVGVFGVTTAR
jgi:predicted ATPase with chaperone activity